MKEHGQKMEEMYDTTVPKNEVVYPQVSLPYEIISDKEAYKIGDVVCVEVYIKINNISEYAFGGDLLKSEVETMDEEKAEGEEE